MTEAKTKAAPKTIVEIISRISDEAGVLGLTQASGVPFAFRGINATVDHLASHLDAYGVVITPNLKSHKIEMHPVGNRFLTDAEVVVEYTFTAPDGSSLNATTVGYAQDYADRAAAQAQSVAFRVALLQTFHLPTSDIEPEANGEATAKITQEERGREAAAKDSKASEKAATVDDLRAQITKIATDPDSAYDFEIVNALGDEITKKARATWFANPTDLQKVLDAMAKGQLPA